MGIDLLAIEELLPNGFHDAFVHELRLDFIQLKVELVLDVLMACRGEPEDEGYKKCRLTLHDYAAAVLEPAVAYRGAKSPDGLEIDRTVFNEDDQRRIKEAGYKVPDGNFWLAFFVYDWNSRIVINARDATLEFL